jgi:hypothetical protein
MSPTARPRSPKRSSENPSPETGALPRRRSFGPWLLLLAILIATAILRLPTIDTPLERDEGEYAYAGQLLLQGVPPYAAAYNMKFPGIYAAYALVLAAFGSSARGVHLGLLMVNGAAIVLVFLLARRLYGRSAGVVAAATYALLSMSRSVLGMAGHATQFVVPPALLGALLLAPGGRGIGRGRLFASGLCMGVALLVKQHGFGFALFGVAIVIGGTLRMGGRSMREALVRIGIYTLGVVVPLAATCVALYRAGVLDRFWFWTVDYARAYTSERGLGSAWLHFWANFRPVAEPSTPLWLVAGAGMALIWLGREERARARFVTALFAGSMLAILPGLWFRQHYFILLLPVVAILVGATFAFAARWTARWGWPRPVGVAVPLLLFLTALTHSLVSQKELFVRRSPAELSRDIYGGDPFPEALEIARYIAAHSRPESRIAVLGSEPEIYFYANRRSATGYIYTYALVERQPYARRMQEEMIREIEAAKPEFLVFVHVWTSWLAPQGSGELFLDWCRRYSSTYNQVGVAEITPQGTTYRWGAAAAAYTGNADYSVYVFQRPRG